MNQYPDRSVDWQDIAQELRLHLLAKEYNYDPSQDYACWAYKVCRLKMIDIYRKMARKKRSMVVGTISLEELYLDFYGV